MYQVYGAPRNRTVRVLWMLEELGQAYDLVRAEPRSETAFHVNPSGKVPALADDGAIITDSVAICHYLADKHEALTYRAGTLARARQDAATLFVIDEIEGPLWALAKHKFILPEALRWNDIHGTCEHEFRAGLASLERRLEAKPFLTGDAFTVPDLIMGHCLGWAMTVRMTLPDDGPLPAYAKRVLGREALARARAREIQFDTPDIETARPIA
ncbi:MAG: glutathione S-transferase family protein [Hyphomicrobiaceae bacterium]